MYLTSLVLGLELQEDLVKLCQASNRTNKAQTAPKVRLTEALMQRLDAV